MRGWRKFLLALALSLVLPVAFACTAGSAKDVQRQAELASAISQKMDRAESLLQESQQEIEDLGLRVSALEKQVGQFEENAQVHALDRTADIPDPPPGKVALRLRFSVVQGHDPLPGEGLRAHETTPEVSTVWAMESLEKGQEPPVGPALKDGILYLSPGEGRTVAVVYRNPTDREVGFMVLPHQESPGNLAQHVWPQCLCMSYVYKAPPEGSWYRVIKVTVSPDIPTGSKVEVVWPVLTNPSVFPSE